MLFKLFLNFSFYEIIDLFFIKFKEINIPRIKSNKDTLNEVKFNTCVFFPYNIIRIREWVCDEKKVSNFLETKFLNFLEGFPIFLRRREENEKMKKILHSNANANVAKEDLKAFLVYFNFEFKFDLIMRFA